MGNYFTQIQCTSPIDIVRNLQTEKICKLKCSYKFKYAPTTLSIYNMGHFLYLETDLVSEPPVIYNDENYFVASVMLFQPSIHTFNGKQADAELQIFHINARGNKKLMVCVPIVQSSTSTSDSSTFFDLIIGEVAQTAPGLYQHTIFNNATFSLSKFIPMKPYFSYTGFNLLWEIAGAMFPQYIGAKCLAYKKNKSGNQVGGQCTPGVDCESFASDVDFIVFHVEDAIKMSPQALNTFKNITPQGKDLKIPTIKASLNPTGLFFNPNGPVPQSSGEIYIDCRPTGDDGEVLVTARQDTGGLIDTAILKKIWNYTFMKMIVGAILMIILWRVSIKVIDGIAASSTRMSGGGSTKASIPKDL